MRRVQRAICLAFGLSIAAGLTCPSERLAAQIEAEEGPARAVAAEVEARYGALPSLHARFEQRYEHRLHRRVDEWSGQLWLARPGQLRVQYDTPRGRLVVSDGARLMSFDPEPSPGVYYEQAASEDTLPVALGLLAGTRPLEQAFAMRLLPVPSGTRGVVLELRPRDAVPLYERVLLYVDRSAEARGRVHRILVVDHAGNTNLFELREQREDARPAASLFTFRPPAGAHRVQP